jgi:hypothetical protein
VLICYNKAVKEVSVFQVRVNAAGFVHRGYEGGEFFCWPPGKKSSGSALDTNKILILKKEEQR